MRRRRPRRPPSRRPRSRRPTRPATRPGPARTGDAERGRGQYRALRGRWRRSVRWSRAPRLRFRRAARSRPARPPALVGAGHPRLPSPGILFKDITPLLADGAAWRVAVDHLAGLHGIEPVDRVVGIEARGFVMGAAVAYRLGVGFIPLRKPNKLPHTTRSVTYALEYGSDTLEMHVDAVQPGERVLIIDDVLATGGTAAAAARLLTDAGATVAGLTFLLELGFLHGRDRLDGLPVSSLLVF
ncbi:MAG: adenine phosphoribosyltransferase [Acidimicrobiales bacterium]